MPAYKDKVDRMSAQEFARFLLKDRICKNCKWWQVFDDGITVGFQCRNDKVMIFEPPPGFGCNLWRNRDE